MSHVHAVATLSSAAQKAGRPYLGVLLAQLDGPLRLANTSRTLARMVSGEQWPGAGDFH